MYERWPDASINAIFVSSGAYAGSVPATLSGMAAPPLESTANRFPPAV